jgi:glycopeptide antibiotics resistance protein
MPRLHVRDVLLLGSLLAILAFTLVPLDAENELELIPLSELVLEVRRSDATSLLELLVESAANILLFIPLGVALGLRGMSKTKTALLAFVLSTVVEVAQLLVVSGRTTSVDDVFLNTLGAVLGQLLLMRLRANRLPHRQHRPS